ncbi:MAG: hypothetical protein HY268_20270 [Deltaproteobacteria bacterium]|nr:hypothetical protein [Deltaproteobacteria bacterium]
MEDGQLEQLIWYTVPGALVVAAMLLVWPHVLQPDGMTALIIAGTPLLGFVIHQAYRLFFEWRGGFTQESRRSLDILWQAIARPCGFENSDHRYTKSFLIWEITFYGEEIPEGFRGHDRGAWHYILSFRASSWSSFFAAFILVWAILWRTYTNTQQGSLFYLIIAALVAVAVGFIFCFKGKQTHESLMNQEIAVIYRYAEKFSETARKLRILDKGDIVARYVAWVDILGFASLMTADGDRAKRTWTELRELVKKHLPAKGGAQVYGINDGFFAISEDPALLQGLVSIYQSWFDKFAEVPGSRPLLRGAISTASAEITPEQEDSNVCLWLEGPGFRYASEYEQLLRGSRLFIDPTAIKVAESEANLFCYEWEEISGWELPENSRGMHLGEVLWPISEDSAELLVRAEKSFKLYDGAFADFLRKEADVGLKDALPKLLQYEETLKLMLRSIGKKLHADAGKKEELEQFVSRMLKYRPDQFRLTWGVTFVALEAVFLAGCLDAHHYARCVKEYLGKQSNNLENVRFVKDFEEELKLSTYKRFSEWWHSNSR